MPQNALCQSCWRNLWRNQMILIIFVMEIDIEEGKEQTSTFLIFSTPRYIQVCPNCRNRPTDVRCTEGCWNSFRTLKLRFKPFQTKQNELEWFFLIMVMLLANQIKGFHDHQYIRKELKWMAKNIQENNWLRLLFLIGCGQVCPGIHRVVRTSSGRLYGSRMKRNHFIIFVEVLTNWGDMYQWK